MTIGFLELFSIGCALRLEILCAVGGQGDVYLQMTVSGLFYR